MAIDIATQLPAVTAVLHYKDGNDLIPVTSGSGLPVTSGATAVTKSGTITLGGTAQTVMAANTSRKGYFFQNLSTETMWGSFLGNAAADTAGSFEIAPKAVISSGSVCETNALSVVSATTGSKFTAWEM